LPDFLPARLLAILLPPTLVLDLRWRAEPGAFAFSPSIVATACDQPGRRHPV